MEHIVVVSEEESGERIDALLAASTGMTRSQIQRLCESGALTQNGEPVRKNRRCSAGERYCVAVAEPELSELLPQELPLDIVYEDADVIVVCKARGMVVHPAPGHPDGTLVNALLYHCGAELSGIGGERRPGIVHRIDRDTSGLIIAAKNDFAHQSLSAQLADRSLSREYEAIVRGRFREDSGTVSAPIGRHPTDRKRMAVSTRDGARNAVTHWEVLQRWEAYTHLLCRLETGRTHQIRVHMAHIGHPVLGDMVYGRGAEKGLEGQCLHARRLKFIHPRSGERIVLEAPLPEYFCEVIRKLGAPEGD